MSVLSAVKMIDFPPLWPKRSSSIFSTFVLYGTNSNCFSLSSSSVCAFLSVGAELLSVLDENENGFVWEHIQSYQEQAHGAWLGMTFNTKGNLFNHRE